MVSNGTKCNEKQTLYFNIWYKKTTKLFTEKYRVRSIKTKWNSTKQRIWKFVQKHQLSAKVSACERNFPVQEMR